MTLCKFGRLARAFLLPFLSLLCCSVMQAQGARKSAPATPTSGADADHEEARSEWFLRGRKVSGQSAAELRRRAYRSKMQARAARMGRAPFFRSASGTPLSSSGWSPLGPVPLASDGTGSGLQDYHQVSGRATAIAIDPADATGNTIYIGGAQGGVWKSTNAGTTTPTNVVWTALTDDQATLSVGAIAIQPGNSDPSKSVILVATGEADNAADSYFGLGILRSADAGNTWTLSPSSDGGANSFSGLGGTRMAFSTATGQTNTVVAAIAATTEGMVEGALTANTYRGLYTSLDAGQTWTYDAIFAGGPGEATSATSVVYNAAAGLFFAALRYHGFYSSPDGVNWTALPSQPGSPGLLSAAACPQSYLSTCPIYRGEITVVPGRNEMYAWFVSLNSGNSPVDQGIWQSENGGASWTQISDNGIANCGDFNGCGVEQGVYNLALLAVPNGSAATDLYAGGVNLYKCSISSANPTCSNTPFINLTHVYGCDPYGALAHVHPDQHAIAYTIPSSGADLMYFANDGGIYRALNGFTGLTTGSCLGTNQFDDLNQNLGSMTQFVAFSQHTTNVDLILGGTQDNGSPATATATTSLSWGNVLSGDGGYNAIDSNTGNWFASNPDTGDGGLNIQVCSSGVSCNDSLFNVVVSSADIGGDDGSLYFPYILDPQSASSLLLGTCRVWRGPRSGGAFFALSLNFETFGTGICAGTEENVIRALAAGGATDANGSQVIYATTDSLGPNNLQTPPGGNIWVTTNASPVSGASSTFGNVTLNGPGGVSINPGQFPISGVAIDSSDPTGNTAYVTLMGFTGGPGHVWQTTNAGTIWSDFSGSGANAIPDSPANAVAIDPVAHMVYVGTDVGVFQSSTVSPAWTEVGPLPGGIGFLPNVAVTALGIFNSGGQKLLRASTYGRGVWQYNLLAVPDFQIAVSNTPQTVFAGGSAVFNGTLTAVNGYNNNVDLSCAAGSTAAPIPCIANPVTLTPTAPPAPPATFTVTTGGTTVVADYFFNVQGVGFDPNGTTHDAALTLHVVNWSVTEPPSPNPVTAPVGGTSQPVSFQITAQGTFSQSVALTCSFIPTIPGATCALTPGGGTFTLSNTSPQIVTASVVIPPGTTPGPYGVTVQASTAGSTLSTSFTADVGPNFVFTDPTPFPNVKEGSTGTAGSINISSQGGFAGTVTLSCVTTLSNTCSVSPISVTSLPATATLTINAGTLAAGTYQVSVQGVSGTLTNSLVVPFNIGDYAITGTQTLTSVPGGSVNANTTFASEDSYSGTVALACDASALQNAQCALSPAGSVVIGSGGVVAVAANVTVPSNAVVGTYNINLNTHDVAGEPIHNWTMPLTVQDFTFGAVTPPTQTVGAGQSASYNLTVRPVGASFVNAVSLTCSVVPANSTCTLAPNSVTPGSGPVTAVATIATSSTMAQGNYTFSVIGTSGISHSVTASLIVGNSLQLAIANPFPAGVAAGAQLVPATITLTSNYIGSVNASCGLSTLSGVQCTLTPSTNIPVASMPNSIAVLISLPNNALPGNYSIAINVADSTGTPSASVILPFTVVQDYSIGNFSAASQTIGPGQSITYNLSVSPVGAAYSNAITLNCSVFPAFSGTCTFSPNPVSPLSNATSAGVVMTVTAPSTSAELWQPPRRPFYSWWLAVVGILVCGSGNKRRGAISLRLGMMMVFLFSVLSCGGGSNGGSTPPSQGTPVTYTITVTGSPASISQSAGSSVTLIVQ